MFSNKGVATLLRATKPRRLVNASKRKGYIYITRYPPLICPHCLFCITICAKQVHLSLGSLCATIKYRVRRPFAMNRSEMFSHTHTCSHTCTRTYQCPHDAQGIHLFYISSLHLFTHFPLRLSFLLKKRFSSFYNDTTYLYTSV